ncbi:protein kilB [Streptomyces sp. NBC_00144]|uniref:protein kilB n=1 Tax=Streptomyces sp. NBC_00144 TaxID=2975665 RepID=UPI00324AA6F3
MIASLIAVLGTLLGSITAYLLQQRTARTDRAEARAETGRRDRISAVTAVVVALADHRRAMWVREDLRLSGADDSAYQAARSESHTTRSALTAPLTTVAILAPELAGPATDAARATYALRSAPDAATLAVLRTEAMTAADRLISRAAALH